LRETQFFPKQCPEFEVRWVKEEKFSEMADEILLNHLKPFLIVRELQEKNAMLIKKIRKASQDSDELEIVQKESRRLREEINGYRRQKEGISETGEIV
jgi:FtsZ-binding cell division protein ZapB